MREQELWRRLHRHVGEALAASWAHDIVLADLGGRTVLEALEDGIPTQSVWRAVWAFLELPASEK